jgi:guanylate kinase
MLSRSKRPGEVDGVDYIFVTKQQFEEWIDSKELLEWALVYGEYKGIPQSRVSHFHDQILFYLNHHKLLCNVLI